MKKGKLTRIKEHVFGHYLHYLAGGCIVVIVAALIPQTRTCVSADSVSILGHGLTVLAVLFAGFQIKGEHDWNRRNSAMEAARQANENDAAAHAIDKDLNYIRRKFDDPITVDEIHDVICQKDDDGKLLRDEADKLLIDHKNQGGAIKQSIMTLLNSSEYLATGVVQGVFDETVIYKLRGGILMSNYFIFENYIKHLNDMYPDREGKIYENLKYMAEKFRAEEIEDKEGKVKERGKTG